MAKIFIEALEVETIIGICAWEREVPQVLLFDIEMEADIGAAASSDKIEDALDYAEVAAQIVAQVKSSPRELLEPLLHDLAQNLLKSFTAIDALTLTVRKPQAIAEASCAGISTRVQR